jgi:hypothetical protein
MAIFNSYVKLPEGTTGANPELLDVWSQKERSSISGCPAIFVIEGTSTPHECSDWLVDFPDGIKSVDFRNPASLPVDFIQQLAK